MIDLRSDTVTRPCPDMLQAMVSAEVGDDVLGDDPTAARLEREGAARLGFEAALFVPSGTMGNELAIRCHTEPGAQVLCEASAHIYRYESGAPAALSGVLVSPVPGTRGVLSVEALEEAVFPWAEPFARPRLLCLENTHNSAGGTILQPEQQGRLVAWARSRALAVHLDGARLWHAAAALGVPVADLTVGCDSASVCLSKGLGAPVGSLLCGSRALIAKARWLRKQWGGGMRQVGYLAAAGLYALEHNVGRLVEDHRCARSLATMLAGLPGVSVDLESVQTNIVYFSLEPSHPLAAPAAVARLEEEGVRTLALGPRRLRAVWHKDAPAASLSEVLAGCRRALAP